MEMHIRQVEGTDGRFVCSIKNETEFFIDSPDQIMVKPHQMNLQSGLRWYFDDYPEMPAEANKIKAENIMDALALWAKKIYQNLSKDDKVESPHIQIISDIPAVLAWPWEAIDHKLQICRKLSHNIKNPVQRVAVEPLNKLNILYIISRPHGDKVKFQTLSKQLIDFVYGEEESWPVRIDVLRPPTFKQLKDFLKKHPDFYHIIHFDGHGTFDEQGYLLFEKDFNQGLEPDYISAGAFAELLAKYNIPIVILNACQSAMINAHSSDNFASVATSLLKAGVHSVVAMGYNIRVSATQEFVSGFYRKLFESSDILEAIKAGRKQMYNNKIRTSVFGEIELSDWLVPVLYWDGIISENILPKLKPTESSNVNENFIGRDDAILQLERAIIYQKPAGIIIHGIMGTGKTSLANSYVQWLFKTNGIGEEFIRISFENRSNIYNIITSIAERVLGIDSLSLPDSELFSATINYLKENQYLLLWDNFESIHSEEFTNESREQLKQFLTGLHGGKTKVLITSRSSEKWLTEYECSRLPLYGLIGDELLQFCDMILNKLNIKLDRKSISYINLLGKLDGNPLAIQAVFSNLRKYDVHEMLMSLENNKEVFSPIFVAVNKLAKPEIEPILRLIGLHEYTAFKNFIETMMQLTGWEAIDEVNTMIEECFNTLELAGLCQAITQGVYQLHPALCETLSQLYPATDAEKQIFIEHMRGLAAEYAPKESQQQHSVLSFFHNNLLRALRYSEEFNSYSDSLALITCLASYAYNRRRYLEAEMYYSSLIHRVAGDDYYYHVEASAYIEMGRCMELKREFDVAKDYYYRAIEIYKKHDEKDSLANVYHQLGNLSYKLRDIPSADKWHHKSLNIKKKSGNKSELASAYFAQGDLCFAQRDHQKATKWYKKALEMEEQHGDKAGEALIHHQLGVVADDNLDWSTAERHFLQSVHLNLNIGNEYATANTYNHLGITASKQGDFTTAKTWYKRALDIWLNYDNQQGVSGLYHQLGIADFELGDYHTARNWFLKALQSDSATGDINSAAITYYQLGKVSVAQQEYKEATQYYSMATEIWEGSGDYYALATTYNDMGILLLEQDDIASARKYHEKAIEICRAEGYDQILALSCNQMANLIVKVGEDLSIAEELLNMSLSILENISDFQNAEIVKTNLINLRRERR